MSLLWKLPDQIQSFTLALSILKLIIILFASLTFKFSLLLLTSADQLTNIFTKPIIPSNFGASIQIHGAAPYYFVREKDGGVNSGEQDSTKPKALSATSYLSSRVKEPVAK